MADIIQLRRDTAANWVTANPVLADGEIGIETDTRKRKCGNGTTAWNSLPYMYSDDLDQEPTANSHKPVESVGVWEAIRNNGKGAFDISAYKAVGGVLAKFDDLAQALGTNGANVPAAARKPGMSVCFVLNSDNKYVQFRLMATSFSTTPSDWQGIDDEPTAASDNLVKSGAVHQKIMDLCKNLGAVANGASIDIDNLPNGIICVTSTGVPRGCPPEVEYGGGTLIITMRKSGITLNTLDTQYIISSNDIFRRAYYKSARPEQSTWLAWTGTNFSDWKNIGVVNDGASIDIDNLPSGITCVTSAGVPSGCPPEANYSGGVMIITMRKSNTTLNTFDTQYIISSNEIFRRAYYKGAQPEQSVWMDWTGTNSNKTFECGEGKRYTRLRDAMEAAILYNGSKVIVYPGTYDLTQEFATELENHSGSGILLTNDVHLLFMPGAYVTCMVDVSNEWAYTHFEPFRVNSGNFTLENANIKCKNTRYCVHDELGGAVSQYIHKYVNCTMDYVNEQQNVKYVQCIGGGLGQNGYIEIIGGYYKSFSYYPAPNYYPSVDDLQQPITYHNSKNADADSHIIIRDVYLADKGYFRFGNYGPSTKLTRVQVCGCRMYKPVLLMNETFDSSQVQNFEIISFNNEIINP